MSYQAIVTRIHTRPFLGADHILLGDCMGYQVIVGADTQDGDIGLFFEQGGQLSEEYAAANDLIKRKNDDGSPAGGMFEPNRRVRAIKLRGERSEGFWTPLSSLAFCCDPHSFSEGDQLDSAGKVPICTKYETPATRAAQRNGKVGQPKAKAEMPKHVDTNHLRRGLDGIPIGARLYITEKLHGTSFRYGHVKVTRPATGMLAALARLFRRKATKTAWEHVNGSRNIILLRDGHEGFHGSDSFRAEATKNIYLHKGEIIFGELVGYANGKAIMKPHVGPELKEHFGKGGVTYTYGAEEGETKLFVYRIAIQTEDGALQELSWEQVKGRCEELGLAHVPEMRRTWNSAPLILAPGENDPEWPFILRDMLMHHVNEQVEIAKHSTLDHRHPLEGVVVRWEYGNRWGVLKHKSFLFNLLEGRIKDSDDYVDTEEAA